MMDPDSPPDNSEPGMALSMRTVLGSWMGAFWAGCLVGMGDSAVVLAKAALDLEPLAELALMACSSVAFVGIAIVLVSSLLLFVWSIQALFGAHAKVLLLWGNPRITPTWWGFAWSVPLTMVLGWAQNWFAEPAPFVQAPLFHGHPLVAVVVLLVAAIAGRLLVDFGKKPKKGRTPEKGRAVLVLVLGVVLAFRTISTTRSLPSLGKAAKDAPNLLLVTLDTTRADYIGWHQSFSREHEKASTTEFPAMDAQTPAFDQLADAGVGFAAAMSQIPVTGPSHATILSGQGPWDHGILLNGVAVDPALPIMSETLRGAGYQSAAFVSAFVLDGDLGFSRGFSVYDDDFGWLQGWSDTVPGRIWAMLGRRLDPHEVVERKGKRTVNGALRWLESHGKRKFGDEGWPIETPPFFLWVHLFDAHGPYQPPPPWDTAFYSGDPKDPAHASMAEAKDIAPYLADSLSGITDANWVRTQYAGEIAAADAELARLLQWLEHNDREEDTLVVVVGDHGENLGEHDIWFNHGSDLFDTSLHVPLAMRFPGRISAGNVVTDPVELTDVSATIYELLGVDKPPTVYGDSLVPSLFGVPGAAFARSLCFDREANLAGRTAGELDRPTHRMASLRTTAGRYLFRQASGYEEAFFDASTNPLQLLPIDDSGLEILSEQTLNDYRHHAKTMIGAVSTEQLDRTSAELDAETRAKLEALGYIE